MQLGSVNFEMRIEPYSRDCLVTAQSVQKRRLTNELAVFFSIFNDYPL